jgi:DNA end-binding protein Ku
MGLSIYDRTMPARPLAAATIAFGLVSIPVKLFSAAESASAVRFNQIDKRDGSRVKQQLVSAKTGEVVPKEDIVKGYEFAKGQYVLFTKEELKSLEAAADYTIDIDRFVPDDAVERLFFDKAYYLGPDKGGARAYRLLARALKATKRIAIGRYAARGKQYLVAVRAMADGLVLEQLHYADEIRSFDEVPLEKVDVKDEELELAEQLIRQSASEEFDPSEYRDEVRERVMALIQRKAEGQDISVSPAEKPEHKIIDIMDALKASLSESPGRKPATRQRRPAQRAAAKASANKPAKKKRARS